MVPPDSASKIAATSDAATQRPSMAAAALVAFVAAAFGARAL